MTYTAASLLDDLGPPPDVPLEDEGLPDSPQTAQSTLRRYGHGAKGSMAPHLAPPKNYSDLGNLTGVLDAVHGDAPSGSSIGSMLPMAGGHGGHTNHGNNSNTNNRSIDVRASVAALQFPRDSATFEVHQLRHYVTEKDGVIAQLESLLKEQSGR